MARYFSPMSVDEFRRRMHGGPEDIRELLIEGRKLSKVNKDLSKIEFDWENCETEDYAGTQSHFMGINALPNGMPFLGMMAGGDWEVPVYFIVYHDGKELRGYVPKDGNTYNLTTKAAYGNDEDEDEKDAKKRGITDPYDLEPDFDKLRADIMGRILPRPEESK